MGQSPGEKLKGESRRGKAGKIRRESRWGGENGLVFERDDVSLLDTA
jgi:hypothetical protein